MTEASKKNAIATHKPVDHWAFLEHIDAPMWIDLTLEAKSGGQEIGDDDWFHTSHPFHQLSARELKSKFSHAGEEILTSEADLQGLASPELPSSVSRSRGKHYNRKKWDGVDPNILLDKQKGWSGKGFQHSSFGQEVNPKSKSHVNRPKGLSSARLGLVVERNFRGKTESVASCSNPMSSSSVDNKTGRKSTRSTITSENTLQQQKYREGSSRLCNQKNRRSSVRRVSLGKSCVTKEVSRIRQQQKCMEMSCQPCDRKSESSSVSSFRNSYVTKVEIGGDSMQSRGRKSSSRKSSVGSCSNPSNEVKIVSKLLREKITDEKGEITMNLAVKNQRKLGEISKTSTISVEEAKSGNQKGSNINFAKPAYRIAAKSLVQYQSPSSKALLQSKVNKENTRGSAKEKPGTSKVNSLIGKGKKNATRNVTVNRKCIVRGVPTGAVLKNHRTKEHNHLQKSDTAGSTPLTILRRDTNQREAKNQISLARRIYLR